MTELNQPDLLLEFAHLFSGFLGMYNETRPGFNEQVTIKSRTERSSRKQFFAGFLNKNYGYRASTTTGLQERLTCRLVIVYLI